MHSSALFSLALFGAAFSAPTTPFKEPTNFARGNPARVAHIAGGAPPNSPPPANISATAIAGFTGANFLENLESAFFFAGLQNLTHTWNSSPDVIAVVRNVIAQEEVHVQTIENLLSHFKAPTLDPCKYVFPVTSEASFLQLANIITSVGIGAVINLASTIAVTDPGLVPGPASILAVEARHDAFFRISGLNAVPNPAPFDTRISGAWALNLANQFVVPGSCPPDQKIKFPIFPTLTVIPPRADSPIVGTGCEISFIVDTSKLTQQEQLFVGWVNQANVPVYTPAKISDGKVHTSVPAGLSGVAFAALTDQTTATDVNALTEKTLAGPAPVQIS